MEVERNPMKKGGLWLRSRDGLQCLAKVFLEGLCGLLPWNRAPKRAERHRPPEAAVEAPVHRPSADFPPGDWRGEALRDFTLWLKELDTAAPPARDLDLSHDLFEVLTELSSFRQEVKRQSREQGKLNEELARLDGLYREALVRLNAKGENLADLEQTVKHETERTVFLLFADLRDALQRGLAEVQRAAGQETFFRKLPPAWTAVREGYEIALSRFDRAMANLGIHKVLTDGQPFDSRLMTAIATREAPGMEPATVLEESLSGYVRGQEVLRTAQVVVAANPVDLEAEA